jgi:hypothetical protein
MKIHEYQAKGILKKYGVAVPRGAMAATREEAEAAAKDILGSGATGVVVKAPIHAGGRGTGGGGKIAKSVEEAGEFAGKMLGMKLVTHQTGPEGRIVHRLLVEETLPIEKELYLGILVDRGEGKPVFMASAAGGMDIEQVAAERPEAILKQYIDPGMGLEPFQARMKSFGKKSRNEHGLPSVRVICASNGAQPSSCMAMPCTTSWLNWGRSGGPRAAAMAPDNAAWSGWVMSQYSGALVFCVGRMASHTGRQAGVGSPPPMGRSTTAQRRRCARAARAEVAAAPLGPEVEGGLRMPSSSCFSTTALLCSWLREAKTRVSWRLLPASS